MAWEQSGCKLGELAAAADYSAVGNQYKLVKVTNASGVPQATLCAAVTDRPIGVLQNRPVAGQSAEIMTDGISKVQLDGTTVPGDQVGVSADGQVAVYVPGTDTTKYIIGVCLIGGAAGEIGTIIFDCKNAARGA